MLWPSSARAALVAVLVLAAATPARAGIFDDDEARRAILDLRQKIDQGNEQARARQAEQMSAMSAQLDQLKRSLLDLNGTIEGQRSDNARLRGQMEELARTVAELQRKQADMLQGVEERIRKVEPQKVTVDEKEISVDPDEKRIYDDALASFRKGDFDRSASNFSGLLRRFPGSGYRESALFWLGNAQYGRRDYKEAIGTFRSLVAAAPESARAPEAMLAIANCQAE
ncbi:MAG: tetratricopeptide repeat protein, partial [Caldimonas sp.]